MRYGIVGTGYWASEVHAKGLAAAPDAELAGVWGRSGEKAAALAQRFGARLYDEPARLFADVDAVAFAVPPDVQAPLATEAAQAGCHLLLEKPIALDAAAADALVAAVAANGVASVVFFKLRFDPAVAAWFDDARSRGGWSGATATWVGSIFHAGSPYRRSAWRRRWGAVWDVGPHVLSLTLPILGPVAAVTAVRGPEDTVHVVCSHEAGGSSALLLSLTVPEAARREAVLLYGEHGWSAMPDTGADPAALLRRAADALARSAATGERHECDVVLGREVVRVLDRAQAQVV